MSQIDLQWFAAEDEGKTEKPTEHKLRKAREEGRVAKSQELNGSLVFFFTSLLLLVLGPNLLKRCENILTYFFKNINSQFNKAEFYLFFLQNFLFAVLPFALVGFLAGIIGNIMQNRGWLFTTKTIQPKFSKIAPRFGEYFKRTLFSFQGIFNVLKSIGKIAILAVVAFFTIKNKLPEILKTQVSGGILQALSLVSKTLGKLLIISALILLVIGAIDYFVQKKVFIDNLKMTKQEVKQEYKDLEGDPEIKNRLESAQKEMLKTNVRRIVPQADVVITNPTHFAVALEWKSEISDSPELTAKGEDEDALFIKQIAKENDVPLYEDRPLARILYTNLEVGDKIPERYALAIATIYAQIGYMERRSKNKK